MVQGLRKAILIRTGYTCNNACRFCAQGDQRDTLGDLDDAMVRERIAEALADGTPPVVFAGGEVTVRPELAEWIRLAAEGGARKVIVQTNGRMLAYHTYVQELVDAGCDIFAVALQGATAACHDWLTQAPGSFKQAILGIRNVRDAGATAWVNTVITRSNFRHLPEIVTRGHGLGVSTFRFVWPEARGHCDTNAARLIPQPELVGPFIEKAHALGSRFGRRILVEYPGLETGDHVPRVNLK